MNQTPEMDEKKTNSAAAPIAAAAEHNANFEENIRAIIRSGKPASVIRDELDNYHANDIAEVLETLDTATRKRLYNILSLEMTAEIFTYLDEPAPYLHELGLDRAAAVLAEMVFLSVDRAVRQYISVCFNRLEIQCWPFPGTIGFHIYLSIALARV